MSELGLKILDLTYLVEAVDGDPVFIDEILKEYLSEMAEYVVELPAQLHQGNLDYLVRAAHTIKGASSNVGAARVRETASKLETRVARGQLDGSESLIKILQQEVGRVKELVEREGVPALLNAV